jgi:BirA family transcriptional regulator, biotin operon repressor / biotin---[acetyl-CoA-carboxylase] ligase
VITEEAVAPYRRGRFGRPYLWHASCTSTQDILRRSPLPEGAVAVAEEQTAGRGRSGRSWEAQAGAAILVSVLLRPESSIAIPQLSLVAGLAVAEGLEEATGVEAMVKWPNDVIVGDRKVAGILLETDGDTVVCGIGINVTQDETMLPARPALAAGSLASVTGVAHDRAQVLGAVLNALERRYDAFRAEGIGPLVPVLEQRNWLRGRRVRTASGLGTAGALAPDGQITVSYDDGAAELVASGELTLAQ